FQEWCAQNNAFNISENVLITYFEMLRKKKSSPSLWSTYSMIKSCLNIKKDVGISKYAKLEAFVKRLSEGYVPKKSRMIENNDINQFIERADDKTYLAIKVSSFIDQFSLQ
ncbi:hypothetical protein PPYR_10539, partial [Photinus pyralis]